MVSFAVYKVFSLTQSPLFTFAFAASVRLPGCPTLLGHTTALWVATRRKGVWNQILTLLLADSVLL